MQEAGLHLQPGEEIEGYEVLSPLGSGGVGDVWLVRVPARARSRVGTDLAALKILRKDRVPDRRAEHRFRLEAEVGLRIRHENIVRLHEFGFHEIEGLRIPFVVMERLEGETLQQLLALEPSQSEQFAREIGLQVARALCAVHGEGVIHRDLKPSNVFVGLDDTVKLLDLGVVRDSYSLSKLTQPGIFVGTISYAAPERLSGEEDIEASDLYGLGLVLYELVTGINPFHAPSVRETMSRHLVLEPPPPSETSPGISRWFDNLVMRLLEKDPQDRFPSAQALAQALADPASRLASSWITSRRSRTEAAGQSTRARARLFVGRSVEQARLREQFEWCRTGTATTTLVSGPDGVGKSCIADDLVDWLDHEQIATTVLHGSAVRKEMFDHGHLIVELLHSLVESEMEPGSPSRASDAGPVPGVAELVVELIDGIAAAAQHRPVLVIVEDLHRAPASTLDMLRRLIDGVASSRVAFVLTTRAPSKSLLERLGDRCEHLELGPLDAGDVARLVTRHGFNRSAVRQIVGPAAPDGGLPSALHGRLKLIEELQWVERRGEGRALGENADLDAIPTSESAVASKRLELLDAAARNILSAIALAGSYLHADLAADVTDLSRIGLARRVARLERQGLLGSVGLRLFFADEAARKAVLRAHSEDDARTMHRRLASAWRSRAGRGLTGRAEFELLRHALAAGEYEPPLLEAAVTAAIDSDRGHEMLALLRSVTEPVDGEERRRMAGAFRRLSEAHRLGAASRQTAAESAARLS